MTFAELFSDAGPWWGKVIVFIVCFMVGYVWGRL